MILAVDVGNTKIKVAVFEGTNLVERIDFYSPELQKQIEFTLNKYQSISDLVVAAVGNIPKEAFLAFEKQLNVHFITQKTRM